MSGKCITFPELGLYLIEGFIPAAAILRLCRAFEKGRRVRARVMLRGEAAPRIEADVRRAYSVEVPVAPRRMIEERLLDITTDLSDFFGVALSRVEPPRFLEYEPGGMFRLHRDRGEDTYGDHPACRREVSVVLFLTSNPADFRGGELNLYARSAAGIFSHSGVWIEGRAGLLVAFSSEALHEVEPVRAGIRRTVVSWLM
jgi:predicted 2-oxoglutarate/Fe(II)-dependent dioxygenase YbiX